MADLETTSVHLPQSFSWQLTVEVITPQKISVPKEIRVCHWGKD